MPVIAVDPYLVTFYDEVNSYFLHNATGRLDAVTVLSTGGGYRDIHVRDGLTLLSEVRTYNWIITLLIILFIITACLQQAVIVKWRYKRC